MLQKVFSECSYFYMFFGMAVKLWFFYLNSQYLHFNWGLFPLPGEDEPWGKSWPWDPQYTTYTFISACNPPSQACQQCAESCYNTTSSPTFSGKEEEAPGEGGRFQWRDSHGSSVYPSCRSKASTMMKVPLEKAHWPLERRELPHMWHSESTSVSCPLTASESILFVLCRMLPSVRERCWMTNSGADLSSILH